MSQVKIGINGFGRIGKLIFRSAFRESASKAKIMAVNHRGIDIDYLIYLMKYDSIHGKCVKDNMSLGRFEADIQKTDGGIKVDGHFVRIFSESDPSALEWGKAGAEYICESTG